ncbi:MAG: hypothetical protein M3280_05530 [Actinomycetota bacterium]|nr:hypothetical protein [Actinomycetota bacterium]
MRRTVAGLTAGIFFISIVALAMVVSPTFTPPAGATPVANDEATYQIFGRIFPDPQGCSEGAPETSPWAKGIVCATDFLQFEQLEYGGNFLEETFPKFVEWYSLNRDFKCSGKPADPKERGCKAFKSAGLPYTADEHGDSYVREKRRLHMIRVTDERVPNKGKKYFVFPLSIHGIERAGIEGGIRAAEDLATWGACAADLAPDYVDCADTDTHGSPPYPLLEATPEDSVNAPAALKKAVIYFIAPNPDGWLRGERFRNGLPNTHFYQRYNGNGVDLNRDWPTEGYTFRPYTPASEPETKAFTKVLPAIGPKDKNGNPKWAGGIDLHGQLVDRAFSFTLMGASERPYDKNQRILQLVKGAWADAEQRLAWSVEIKPNDAPPQPEDPRMYGVQWGTVWDTIDYTITGGLGDWIDSTMGLNADGIDNEMSFSHLANCGIGSCWNPEWEQLHVDGNKSLVYSMINYSLLGEEKTFKTGGRVGYLFNNEVISARSNPLKAPPKFTKLPPQDDILDVRLNPSNDYIHEFDVLGPKSDPKVYNGGIAVSLTCAASPISSTCELAEAVLERRAGKEGDPNSEWETVNSFFLQSDPLPVYSSTGKALHANMPTPGRYRVRLIDAETSPEVDADIFFTKEKGWPDPGQIGYRVTNMNFWKDLSRFAQPGLEKVSPGEIENNSGWKKRYDTIVVTDSVFPQQASELKSWVAKQDGNLVLLDTSLRMLDEMGIVKNGVSSGMVYAGYVNFETSNEEPTYNDPLARKIDQPGAAEGSGGGETHRHQTYEPVPIGYSIQDAAGNDQNNSPFWFVSESALTDSQGQPNAVGTTTDTDNVSFGEIKYEGGRIRFLGAVLPQPTEKFDHPFGLANYSVTYSGYQLINNLLFYQKP